MPLTLTQIEHEVDALPKEEQFRLFDHLQERLAPDRQALERIWAEEAHRRYLSLKEGRSKGIPLEQVMVDVRKELAAKR